MFPPCNHQLEHSRHYATSRRRHSSASSNSTRSQELGLIRRRILLIGANAPSHSKEFHPLRSSFSLSLSLSPCLSFFFSLLFTPFSFLCLLSSDFFRLGQAALEHCHCFAEQRSSERNFLGRPLITNRIVRDTDLASNLDSLINPRWILHSYAWKWPGIVKLLNRLFGWMHAAKKSGLRTLCCDDPGRK